MSKRRKLIGLPRAKPGYAGANPMGEAQAHRLQQLANEDVRGLVAAFQKYGDSWRKRGGGEAYHNLTRKWDRIERAVEALDTQDIFEAIAIHPGKTGLMDDIQDLRRYLLLVEEYVGRPENQKENDG